MKRSDIYFIVIIVLLVAILIIGLSIKDQTQSIENNLRAYLN